MTSSLDLLTMCNEFISKTKRFLKSFIVSEDTLALEVIDEVGPGGNYLSHPHTLDHFKEEIWMPELIDRQDYQAWVSSGGKTLKQRVNKKVQWILENHEPERLPEKVERYISETVRRWDRQLAKK